MKKIYQVASIVLGIFILVGCGGGNSNQTPTGSNACAAGQTLTSAGTCVTTGGYSGSACSPTLPYSFNGSCVASCPAGTTPNGYSCTTGGGVATGGCPYQYGYVMTSVGCLFQANCPPGMGIVQMGMQLTCIR